MSCWRKQIVLRLPAKTIGIWLWSDWERFEEEYKEHLDFYPGCFSTRTSREEGSFLDYILEDEAPVDYTDADFRNFARELTEQEKEQYLPLFRRLFPQFSMREMADVHYCAYVWYDGTDPLLYY